MVLHIPDLLMFKSAQSTAAASASEALEAPGICAGF